MNKLETINKIKKFLDGHDNDIKYVTNIEINRSTNYATCFIHKPDGTKTTSEVYYDSFIYTKDFNKLGITLYEGREEIREEKLLQHGIYFEKLRTDNQKRLEDGYVYKFASKKSHNNLISFFVEGGVDPYEKERDENDNVVMNGDMPVYVNRDLFYSPKPFEQFLIHTGIRLYKGFETYNEIHKVIFDIETTGLRYESCRIFAIGVRDNRGFETILEVDKLEDDESEKKLIINFFDTITKLKPAVIAGYNSEDFDFKFIIGRAKKLELDLKNIETTLSKRIPIRRVRGSLKYGSTTERYEATKIWGTSVIDIHHAAKKTAAINSDLKNTKLKYICQFEKISKPNRTYIKGDDGGIGKMYYENKIFLTDENNDYVEIPHEFQDISEKLYKIQWNKNKNKITNEQAKKIRNKILKEEGGRFVAWYKNNCLVEKKCNFVRGRALLRDYLKDDLWETNAVDELYNQSSFMLAKMVPTTYERVCTMGTAVIWELLLTAWSYENNLAIPCSDNKVNFSGGLARCFKGGFSEDIIKIDYASLYPMIQLTHDVFPTFDITGVMKMILIYSTSTRNVYKKIGNNTTLGEDEESMLKIVDSDLFSKYNKEIIGDNEINRARVKQLPIKILNNALFGALGSHVSFKWSDNRYASRITCIGRLELRHAFSWFNNFGCIPLLAVTDGINFQIPKQTNIKVTDDGVNVTGVWDSPNVMWNYNNLNGIQALIAKFNKEEMKPPMSIDDDGSSVSVLNLSRINYATLVNKKDKKTGKTVEVIKLTGNTIKSKVMPEYIEEFIEKGLLLVLKGKGKEFVDYYYDYVEEIFYKRIPLKKIASKSKMKTSISGYLKRGKDKNGRDKAIQAHMELIIQDRVEKSKELFLERGEKPFYEKLDNLNKTSSKPIQTILGYTYSDFLKYASNDEDFIGELTPVKIKKLNKEILGFISDYIPPEPELDSTIYYVNTGYRKSHGDSQIIKDHVTGKKRFSSRMINTKEIIENPNMLGDYNVDKYLDAFNSRVDKILVGFNDDVRKKILAKISRKKKKNESGVSFEQVELVKNVFANEDLVLKNYDLDSLEESLYLEEKEIEFWNDYGYDPKKIWDGFKVKEGDLRHEEYIEILSELNKKMDEAGMGNIKPIDDPLSTGDFVLIKNPDDSYDIGKYDGLVVKIKKYNINVPKTRFSERKNKSKEKENKKIENLNIESSEIEKKLKQFKLFKEKFKIGGDLDKLTMGEFFSVIKEAEKPFNLFVEELNQINDPEHEYVDYDD